MPDTFTMEKTYNPQAIEKETYEKWAARGAFAPRGPARAIHRRKAGEPFHSQTEGLESSPHPSAPTDGGPPIFRDLRVFQIARSPSVSRTSGIGKTGAFRLWIRHHAASVCDSQDRQFHYFP